MKNIKIKTLAKAWGDEKKISILYEDCRMRVICSNYHRYGIENAIGIHWKEVRDENGDMIHNAYPVQGNAYCPLHLNNNLALILLEGLKSNTKNKLKLIEDLIEFYKNKQKG